MKFPFFSRKAPVIVERPEMGADDVEAIIRYAIQSWNPAGGVETGKDAAVAAYRRNLASHAQANIYMQFMAEVDTPAPDLAARAYYRSKIRSSLP
jgi:hypothetical protein